MNLTSRHRLLPAIFWSRPGLSVVRLYAYLSRRWEHVVMNRSLRPESNGEYWLFSLMPPAPLILDVGFNEGSFALEALAQRPQARIIGFEPARSMQKEFAVRFVREPRVELIPLALSNRRSEMDFYDSADGSSTLAGGRHGTAQGYRVTSTTLDDFAEERSISRIDLLKIDVEGYDLHVLEGAERLLRRQSIDIFSFEYNEPWIDSRRFLKDAWAYVEDKPYALFRLFNGFLAPFRYTHRAERHDLGCIYVGVSRRRLEERPIPVRHVPH